MMISDGPFVKNENISLSPLFNEDRVVQPISGFGYDRVKREMKYPVLKSTAPAPSTKVDSTAHRFNHVSEYLNHVFGSKGYFENGLYIQSNSVLQQLVKFFGDYKVVLGASSRHYTLFETNVEAGKTLEDFTAIVNSLPPYDPNSPVSMEAYNLFIHFFGTDISTTTSHGGVVYQQVTVKSCYGGSITEDMLRDIDAFVRRVPPGPTAYAKHRQLGILNMLGGNPELGGDKINERIESFKVAPAPTKFGVQPIWEVVADPTRKQWIKQAIERYIETNSPSINQWIAEANHARDVQFKGPQPIHLMDYHVEQKSNWVVYWTGCPLIRIKGGAYTPHCTLQKTALSMAAGQKTAYGAAFYETQSQIERDAAGNVKTFSTFRGQVRGASAPIRSGCVRVSFGPRLCQQRMGCIETSQRLSRYVCIDCLPVIRQQPGGQYNTIHTFPECHCQGF
jgi:hypothetical protein